jgi:hypothetical protein
MPVVLLLLAARRAPAAAARPRRCRTDEAHRLSVLEQGADGLAVCGLRLHKHLSKIWVESSRENEDQNPNAPGTAVSQQPSVVDLPPRTNPPHPRAPRPTIGRASTLQRPTTAVRVRPAALDTKTSLPLASSDR